MVITWNGYSNEKDIRHSIKISDERFKVLWKEFKKNKISQRTFYFKYINPLRFKELKQRK